LGVVVRASVPTSEGAISAAWHDCARQRQLWRALRQCREPAILAREGDLAAIGHIMAEQDIHQRGLARAVLAQQRNDLAARQIEIDPVIGAQRTEPLGDTAKAQNGLGAGHRLQVA
jgi:hypothetical protein